MHEHPIDNPPPAVHRVAMTTPYGGPQPTPGSRRRTNTILLSIIGLFVLCCGGVTAVTVFGGNTPDTTTAPAPARPLIATVPPTTAQAVVEPEATTATTTTTTRPAPTRTTAKPKPKPKPTTTRPRPRPTTKKPTTAPTRSGVRAGAYCAKSAAGEYGRTKAGKLMRCTTTSSDDRYRWRAA